MITIRPAAIEDLAAVAFLFDQYRQFYQQAGDLNGALAFLRERIEKNESVILVAMDAGEIIGFTQLYPIFSSVSMRKAWLLNDLFVSADQRMKGAATKLLDAAKQFARTQQSKWLLLQTTTENLSAQTLYEKNGWVKLHDLFYQFDL